MPAHLAPREAVVPIPAEELQDWVQSAQVGFYLQVVLVSLVTYDSLITFDKEVKYFWTGKLGVTKSVFFLNRVAGIFGTAVNILWYGYATSSDLAKCNLSQWGAKLSYWIVIISIDYILMIRVLALYQNEKKLKIVLSTLLAMEAIVKLVLLTMITTGDDVNIAGLATGADVCGTGEEPKAYFYVIDWTMPLALGTLLLTLAIIKAQEIWKMNGLRGSTLLIVLIKDQALYFLFAIASAIINIVADKMALSLIPAAVLQGLGSTTLLSMLGSHMFFNLKEAAEHGVNVGTNWASYTQSDIRFEGCKDGEESIV